MCGENEFKIIFSISEPIFSTSIANLQNARWRTPVIMTPDGARGKWSRLLKNGEITNSGKAGGIRSNAKLTSKMANKVRFFWKGCKGGNTKKSHVCGVHRTIFDPFIHFGRRCHQSQLWFVVNYEEYRFRGIDFCAMASIRSHSFRRWSLVVLVVVVVVVLLLILVLVVVSLLDSGFV